MNIRSLRFLPLIIALLLAPVFAQEDDVQLYGTLDENNVYTALGGHYSIGVPVLAELGGTIRDTPTITTFRDGYGTHVVIGCLPFDEPLRAEFEKRGRKDFLSWLFSQQVLPGYAKTFPGTTAESARYLPATHDGTLFAMTLIPNGTAFGDRLFLLDGETPPVAKRGSLVFIKNDRIYIITIELYERILKRDTFKKTPEEEDAILRKRLMDLLARMSFPVAQTAGTPASVPAAVPPPAK